MRVKGGILTRNCIVHVGVRAININYGRYLGRRVGDDAEWHLYSLWPEVDDDRHVGSHFATSAVRLNAVTGISSVPLA